VGGAGRGTGQSGHRAERQLTAVPFRRSTLRWIALAIAGAAALAVAAAFAIGAIGIPRATGYFAPVFAPDGQSIYVIARRAVATVTGFGHTGFTPPASVRLHRDRFQLLNIRLSDGAITVVETFPPSPLEANQLSAYHGAIFGTPHAHLRWVDGDHLDYEVGVTRHDTPLARTFILNRRWDAKAGVYVTVAPWSEAYTTMSGDEPDRLHGDSEVLAVPGDELMPCAIALLDRRGSEARTLIESGCGGRYPEGLTAAALTPFSRRAEIERSKMIQDTYTGLVARGRAAGLPDGDARLRAGEEMSRLGLFPKRTSLVAEQAACDAVPLFDISDDQFTVGLFPDIERAIAMPGTDVDKSMGSYITHREYRTSAQINEWIDGGHDQFSVRARGACWRLTIRRP
jgi:hypothetical protein